MVQDVEELRPELHIKAFRNLLNGNVLKYGKVQVRRTWSDQDVAAGVASQIEALGRRANGIRAKDWIRAAHWRRSGEE